MVERNDNMRKIMTTQCKVGGGTTIQILYRKERLSKTSSFSYNSQKGVMLVGGLIE